MGRLFWKFFLVFWLAQIVTSLGVGAAIWALRPLPEEFGPPPPPPPHEFRPGPDGARPAPGVRPPPRRSPFPPLMPLMAGGAVSLVFAGLLAWYFSRPIRSLRGAFEAVAAGRLDTRVGEAMGGRSDELSDLGADFDRMAARLQGVIDGQRRLLHDVSHELRSPLARLQAAGDLMRQQPERTVEMIERIERDTGRMDRLVGELLTLARLDAEVGGDRRQALDFNELATGVADDAGLEAEARGVTLHLVLDGTAPVRGDADLLRRAIENVVRNAIRHSPRGGTVELVGRAGDGRRCIEVADRGPGVAAHELDAIFEPFRRGTGAAASGEGYGLGLAITRSVLRRHDGTVVAANRSGGGLVVVMCLPAR